MDYERENAKLRACLREIYRTFQYGPGASSSQAPFIMKMIEEALGWEKPMMGGGGGPATFGDSSTDVSHGGSGGWTQTFTAAIEDKVAIGGMGGGGGRPAPMLAVNLGTAPLPSDMPETGIHLDINGKSRTVTKAELRRMIDDGTLKI
jgi:hypothetical protein